ncbi:MAG: response regulator [Dehalococcoidia bacterium]|nr:response regulator [Dehalococcoidia bacterium]
MVVDDEPEMLAMIHQILVLEGYDVDTASNGDGALELFSKCKPDLILLDIMMPGIDGFQVLERVREISDVPVLMLTARGDIENKAKALIGGADDYITKPFMTRELIARIRAKMRRAGSRVPHLRKSSALSKMLGNASETADRRRGEDKEDGLGHPRSRSN